MFTVKKYLKLLSCTDESELDKMISKMSEDDAKSFVKTTILFFQKSAASSSDLSDSIKP